MIPSIAAAYALFELTHDLERIRLDLEARLRDRGQFEGFLMSEQSTWDDQTNPVVRAIALHNVKARPGLTTEAVDGLVRVELELGRKENWHFYYLKEAGFSTPPYETFWVEPVRGEHA